MMRRKYKDLPEYKYVGCPCYKCLEADYNSLPREERTELIFWHPVWLMILCETCRNKRCPKASDHLLACSGSNEAGQVGSLYE
jgi:hypothetical protein